jgi:hypothetical protein
MKNTTRIWSWLALPLVMILLSFAPADARTNFGIGVSVGNYDYLPYNSGTNFSVNFSNVMDDYGYYVDVPRFGRCWRPYTTSGWRPYLYGHWDYTRYGPTWEGYEPWAWAGYHYGNWIWTEQFGWVWVPGYDWHPGRVVWGYGSNSIGWMPAPPSGYSYGCGYLSYGNCGYSDPFYSPRFSNIGFNLFVFIDRHRFFNDNYADYYLGRDYARNVFVRRGVRFERGIERVQLERIVGRRVNEVPVRVRELRMGNRTVRAVIPEGSDIRVRRNAERVVKNVIAPAVQQKRRLVEEREAKRRDEVRSVDRDRSRIIERRTESRDSHDNRGNRDKQFDLRQKHEPEMRIGDRRSDSRDRISSERERSAQASRDRVKEDQRLKEARDRVKQEQRIREERSARYEKQQNDSRHERELIDVRERAAHEKALRERTEKRPEPRNEVRPEPRYEQQRSIERRPEPQVERKADPRDQRKQDTKKSNDRRKVHKPDHN